MFDYVCLSLSGVLSFRQDCSFYISFLRRVPLTTYLHVDVKIITGAVST